MSSLEVNQGYEMPSGFQDEIDELVELIQKEKANRVTKVLSVADSEDLGEVLSRPVRAIPTPFPTWNDLCGSLGGHLGLALGWLIVLAGPTGNGKTRLGRVLARHALKEGHSVGYVALEGSEYDLHLGMVSIGQPTAYRLRPGPNFPVDSWAAMANAFHGELQEREVAFRFTTKPRQLADVLAAMHEMADQGCTMIVLDYLQLVQVSGLDLFAKTSEVMGALQLFTVEREVVTVALSQFNRLSTTGDSALTVHGLAGGAAIENSSDQVVIIDNRHGNRSGSTMEGHLALAKNRHGAPNADPGIRVLWNWHDYTVREVSRIGV